MKRILVIFNPVARRARSRACRQFLERHAGAGVTLAPTQKTGDATRLAAAARDYDLVVAAGGDGTINEVVNGLTSTPLGVLPLGTVNVFAKELGIPKRFEAAWQVLTTGRLRTIDLAVAEMGGRQRRFVQLAGVGFDAAAVRAVSLKLKKKIGPASYVVAGLKQLCAPGPRVELSTGGTGAAVLIGNGRYYGGKVPVFPQARLDDGLLDVCVFEKFGVSELVRYLPAILCGRHIGLRGIRYFQTTELTCRPVVPVELDGEDAGDAPVKFSVLPSALQVVVN